MSMKTIEQMLTDWAKASEPDSEPELLERLCLRDDLITEEGQEVRPELAHAINEVYATGEITKNTKAKLLKELCDLVYVAVETAVVLGLPFDAGFARVHENNMTKLVDGKIVRGLNGKILKPEGYVKVDLREIV